MSEPPGGGDRVGPLLVATDGSDAALGALHVARELELRDGQPVRVMGVVPPAPVFDVDLGGALPEARIHEARREALHTRLEDQLDEVGDEVSGWTVSIVDGVPARRIVEAADRLRARMILLGLGRHGVVERLLGTETALRVAQIGSRPVLAVHASVRALPRRIVAAVDFSPFSERGARTAAPLVDPAGEIHLAHVLSGLENLPFGDDEWRRTYREDVSDRLQALRRSLRPFSRCACETVILSGEPAGELLAYADTVEADLVAAGSHGHSFIGRLVLGSVSSRLLRESGRSVLIAPPGSVDPADPPAAADPRSHG